jgi:TorA maturation chaperone TorD
MDEPVQQPGGARCMPMPMTLQANETAMTLPLQDHDELRANMYGLLGHLLAAPPPAQLLKMLEQIEEAGTVTDDLATSWRLLKVAARDSRVDVLDDEYHDLFIGIGRGELVPYASWYMTGFLMDRPLAWLRGDLVRFGIERQPGSSDPEDHVATLCESMRVIIGAGDIPFVEQRRFFRNHIATWMPVFFRDLQQAKAACLYAAVGALGEAFMRFENRYFELED